MKISWVGGWVVVLGLGCGIWAVDVGAQEVATPGAGLELPASKVANLPQFCRCESDLGERVARIRQILSEPLKESGLDFSEEPLENVINFIQVEYNIPIQVDEPALENAGLTRDEPLTLAIQNVSLQSALRLALKQKQLTYVLSNEVLIITTPEEAESELKVCVYDVRDLIGRNEGNKNLDALADTLSSCVAQQTWAKYKGGEAEIKPLQPGVLVISQTQAVHDEIGGLLSLIRETLREPASESRVLSPRQMQAMVLEGVGGMEGGMGMEEGHGGYGGAEGGGRAGGEMGGQPEPTPADPFH
jgi:hypothetical protein